MSRPEPALDEAVLAEFASADGILKAAARLSQLGYRRMEAWTPYPIPALDPHLGIPRSPIPRLVLAAGAIGAAFAYLLQTWMNAWDYPLNVGGRPLHSGPAWIPITFETTVLFAVLTAVISVFAFSRLPRLHHPLHEIEGFERSTIDRFWLAIDTSDPLFDPAKVEQLLVADLGALRVVTARAG
ncbi:MAG: DUF3341 domain-containing protein [Polyangiales bacterium]